jgi:DNA repair ATPase RecN
MSKIANITDQTAATMQSLNIRDEQLHRFRDRFVKMYTDTSQATRSLASARNQHNNTSAQQAYSALQTATNQEGTLVTEINTYCRGGR